MKDRLYLAYGSNLNVEQMSRRCPYAMPVGTGMIEGYRLLFRGSKTGAYLTIEKSEGDRVPVGVWSVSPSDERALDRYEGFPTFYRKEDFTIEVTGFHGEKKKADCFAYIMNEGRPVEEPSRGYYETCLEGYRQFGFSSKYLEEALRSK